MEEIDRKQHWENIYQTKELKDVSWYQPTPETSLEFIANLKIAKDAKIIDVGGGDSFLAEFLLDLGYTDISVLDISSNAIERAKERMGESAQKVKWIVSDVTQFNPTEKYDLWHDRAAFHFLRSENDIESYLKILNQSIAENGQLIIGTFSEDGPLKCSGIEIKQYSEESMVNQFKTHFEKIACIQVVHPTPFDTTQNFTFCSFKRRN
jgi:ubiquinone/menaquinone biosynthesis C-methylase UbiE